LDGSELIRLAERELAEGNPAARETAWRAHHDLFERRDALGLERLLDLAGRLENGDALSNAVRKDLQWLSRQWGAHPVRSIDAVPSAGRSGGLSLGLASAACWLGSFVGWVYIGGLVGLSMTLLGILAGIILSPIALAASLTELWKARRGGEPLWPPLVGLILSLPFAAFVVYGVIWGLLYDRA